MPHSDRPVIFAFLPSMYSGLVCRHLQGVDQCDTIKRKKMATLLVSLLFVFKIPLSSSLFPFTRGQVLPATFHRLICYSSPPISVSCLLLPVSPSPVFFTSLLTHSSHISLDLPRLLLPCSRNSTALFSSGLTTVSTIMIELKVVHLIEVYRWILLSFYLQQTR